MLDYHGVMSEKHVETRIHHQLRGAREAPECPFACALCVVVRGQPHKEESVGQEGLDLFNSHVLTFLLTMKKLGEAYAGIRTLSFDTRLRLDGKGPRPSMNASFSLLLKMD